MDPASSEKMQTVDIPGIPGPQQQRLLDLLIQQADVDAIWLFGSRAMGRERPGSDIDLCVDAAHLSNRDRLRLMAAIDDLLLPWAPPHPEVSRLFTCSTVSCCYGSGLIRSECLRQY